ncbi:sensor histidine kinase [Paenibacillus sp. P26]|nr:sensor histidine kinase [Paenibacillus sp. P26]
MGKTSAGKAPNEPSRAHLIWLFYLAFPIYSLIRRPVHEMWIGFPLLAVFILIYLRYYTDRSLRVVYVFLLLGIIGFFCLRYSIYFLFMGFYVTPLMGFLRSARSFWTAFTSLLVFFAVVFGLEWSRMDGNDWTSLLPAAVIMLVFPFMIRAGMRSRELKAELHMANEEIARLVQNEERERISRDLHDTLGHTLSLITLKSELAEKLIPKHPERAVQEVKDIQTTARTALKQVRELVSGMNAVSLSDEIRHAGQILAAAGIELEAQGPFGEVEASPLIQNILGLCLREAVTNVVRHSRAPRCIVTLTAEPDRLSLSVRDNGRGAVQEVGQRRFLRTRAARYERAARADRGEASLPLTAGRRDGADVHRTANR